MREHFCWGRLYLHRIRFAVCAGTIAVMKKLAIAVIAALTLAGCGAESEPDPTNVDDSPPSSESSTADPLTAENIVIELRVKAEECFGAAVCNVTLGVEPLLAEGVDEPAGRWEVTYELEGDVVSGTTTQSFVIDEGYIELLEEDVFIQTPKKGAAKKVAATVTDVREG